MLKKLIAALISLALVAGLAPAAAMASEEGGGAAGTAETTPGMALTTQAARKSLPRLYAAGKLTVSVAKSKAYTGKAIKPAPTVKLNGKKLVKGTDYTVVYRDASGKEAVPKKAGAYKVVVIGKGKYRGAVAKAFKVVKKGTTVKNKAFTLTLPAYWTGKVRARSKSLPADDYRGKAGEVCVFDKKTGILLLRIYYGAKNDGGSGSPATYARYAQGGSVGAGDDPWVGCKMGSRYALVVTCNGLTWTIDTRWDVKTEDGLMGLSTVSQANHVADLLTGGRIKNKKQRDAKGVRAGVCIEKYLKTNVIGKIDIR